jgi:hypothetical protein
MATDTKTDKIRVILADAMLAEMCPPTLARRPWDDLPVADQMAFVEKADRIIAILARRGLRITEI